MRILHVLAGAWPGSGIAEVVAGLSGELKVQGHDVTVATLKGQLSCSMVTAQSKGVRVVQFKARRPYSLFCSSEMWHSLDVLARGADVVHVHGAWTFPVWWACHCARKEGKPLVLSPHGSFEPARLRYSRWKKCGAGLLDRYYLRRAAVLHATCPAEAEDVVAYVGEACRTRIATVVNGVDLAKLGVVSEALGAIELHARTVLYLGRLHPLKGVDLLISAWADVMRARSAMSRAVAAGAGGPPPPWKLLIVGPDEQGTLAGLREQVKGLMLDDSVIFLEAIYGEEKAKVIASANLFVLPTRSENFGIVVAEALAFGVPVITTKGAPWPELLGTLATVTSESSRRSALGVAVREVTSATERNVPNVLDPQPPAVGRCGWWTDIGVEPLAVALKEAMSLTDEQRRLMGANGRKLVEKKYTWPKVAKEMSKVYETCVKETGRHSQ